MNKLLLAILLLVAPIASAKTFKVHGVINRGLRSTIAEVMTEIERNPHTITIQLDSPGGRVDIGMEMIEAIWTAQDDNILVVCTVPDKGIASMAFVIASTCDEIHAQPKALMMAHDIAVVLPGMFGVWINRASAKKLYLHLHEKQLELEDIIRDRFKVSDSIFRYLNDGAVFFKAKQANVYSPGFVTKFIKRKPLPPWRRR